jgi:hypothetical protein
MNTCNLLAYTSLSYICIYIYICMYVCMYMTRLKCTVLMYSHSGIALLLFPISIRLAQNGCERPSSIRDARWSLLVAVCNKSNLLETHVGAYVLPFVISQTY